LPRLSPQQLLPPLPSPPLPPLSLQRLLSASPCGRMTQTSGYRTHALTSTHQDGLWAPAPRFSLPIQSYSSPNGALTKTPRIFNGLTHTLMAAFTRRRLSHNLFPSPRVVRPRIRCSSSSKNLLPMLHDQSTFLCMQYSMTRPSPTRPKMGSRHS
ncbi:hypothetical protein BGZ59_003382, partial [Podila verticillata]